MLRGARASRALTHRPSGVSFLARPGRAMRAPWRLARHQSQPSCQVTAAAERLSIAHRRHKGGRRQHADPRDPDQTLGGVLIAYPFGELIVKPFDPTIDA